MAEEEALARGGVCQLVGVHLPRDRVHPDTKTPKKSIVGKESVPFPDSKLEIHVFCRFAKIPLDSFDSLNFLFNWNPSFGFSAIP